MVTSIVEETDDVYVKLGCSTIKQGTVLNHYSLHIETLVSGTIFIAFDEFEISEEIKSIELYMRGHNVFTIHKDTGSQLYTFIKTVLKRALEEWSDELPGWVYEGVSEVANPYRVEV